MQRIQTKVTLTGSTRCSSAACALGGQRVGRPIDGVGAVVKHRTRQVKGVDQDDSLTLRLAATTVVTEVATLRGVLFGPKLG